MLPDRRSLRSEGRRYERSRLQFLHFFFVISFLARGGSFLCWLGLIELDGGADEIFQAGVVDFVALEKIDGSPLVAAQPGVKELGGIGQAGAVGKSELHLIFKDGG